MNNEEQDEKVSQVINRAEGAELPAGPETAVSARPSELSDEDLGQVAGGIMDPNDRIRAGGIWVQRPNQMAGGIIVQ